MGVRGALIVGGCIIAGFAILGVMIAPAPSPKSGPSPHYELVVLDNGIWHMVETHTGRVFTRGGSQGMWIEDRIRRPWASE